MNEYGEQVKNQMNSYMNNPDSIDEEVSDIQNATHGVEVRGALAAGIKKSFDKSVEAETTSDNAQEQVGNIQNQVDQLVIEGDSSVEAAQARVDADNNTFATLKQRLDTKEVRFEQQLTQTEYEKFKSSLLYHRGKRPMIIWHDDDAHKGVYTKLAPLLRQYGIKMSSAVITDRPHGFPIEGLPAYDPNSYYMSYDEMKELEEEGIVEFIPHTHTHDIDHSLTDMTEEEIHVELSTNKDIMKQLGWNYKDLVYPFGRENPFVHSIVRQYFRSAFDVGGGALTTPLNQFKIPRIQCDAPATFEEIKAQIDDVINGNTLGVLTTHVDQYGGLDLNKMEQVIQYCLSNGLEFVTTNEAINEFGNLLQVGSNSIGHDGSIHGKELGVYRNGHLDYAPNAPITDFPKGTVTRIKVTTPLASQYNLQRDTRLSSFYGFIEVHRDLTDDQFSIQKFTDLRNERSFSRPWDVENEAWGKWVDSDSILYYKKDTNNNPPSFYDDLKVTVEKVTGDDSDDYGLGGPSGLIYTPKDIESAFTSQIMVPSRFAVAKNGLKIRYAESDSEWGSWYSIPINNANFRRVFTTVNIAANSSGDRITTSEQAIREAYYIANVTTPLPTGVTVNAYCWKDGEMIIRFTNATNSSVTLTDVEVRVGKLSL